VNNRQRYNFLVRLFILEMIISLILFFIDLILTLWINNALFLNDIIYILLTTFLISFEFIRIMAMAISETLIIRIKMIGIKFQLAILTSLLIGFGYNILFLVRLFGAACFTPVYSVASTIFICISFVLILIPKHDNN